MPTEPRQVEVEGVMGDYWVLRPLRPDSLTARMLDLAEAVMARDDYKRSKQNRHMSRAALNEYDTAIGATLAAVRQHKDYRRPE